MLEIGTLTNRVMEQPWNQIYIIESESEDRFVTLQPLPYREVLRVDRPLLMIV